MRCVTLRAGSTGGISAEHERTGSCWRNLVCRPTDVVAQASRAVDNCQATFLPSSTTTRGRIVFVLYGWQHQPVKNVSFRNTPGPHATLGPETTCSVRLTPRNVVACASSPNTVLSEARKKFDDAREKIAAWGIDYDEHRLHGALDHLTPREFVRKRSG